MSNMVTSPKQTWEDTQGCVGGERRKQSSTNSDLTFVPRTGRLWQVPFSESPSLATLRAILGWGLQEALTLPLSTLILFPLDSHLGPMPKAQTC